METTGLIAYDTAREDNPAEPGDLGDKATNVTTMHPDHPARTGALVSGRTCYIDVVPVTPQEMGGGIDQPPTITRFWASGGYPNWICGIEAKRSFTYQLNEDYLGYYNDAIAVMSPGCGKTKAFLLTTVTVPAIAEIQLTGSQIVEKRPANIVGIKEAYGLALDTLRTFKARWNAYTEEEARFYSAFEDEGIE